MEVGEFHWARGWYFKRLEDGAVRIRQKDGDEIVVEAVIPPDEWASIVSHVSRAGEPASYKAARALHA